MERNPPGFFALFSLSLLDVTVPTDTNFIVTAIVNTAKTGTLADVQRDICIWPRCLEWQKVSILKCVKCVLTCELLPLFQVHGFETTVPATATFQWHPFHKVDFRQVAVMWKDHDIQHGFKRIGRPPNVAQNIQKKDKTTFKKQQGQRNAIEATFGHLKERFNLDKIVFRVKDGAKIQIRLGLVAMNLHRAATQA